MKEKELNKFTMQKVKIIERNGKIIEHLLCKSDPWGDDRCEREDCFMCLSSEKEVGKCRKSNVVYHITCRLCEGKGEKVQYWGESSRSGYLRGREHRQDLENKEEGSHMLRHLETKHPELDLEDPENVRAEKHFKMEMDRQYSTAMDRQISEALAIARSGGMGSAAVMNNCDEYTRCTLPELQTTNEVRLKEKEKRCREIEETTRRSKRQKMDPNPSTEQVEARGESNYQKIGVQGGSNPGNTPVPRPPQAPQVTQQDSTAEGGGKIATTTSTESKAKVHEKYQQHQQDEQQLQQDDNKHQDHQHVQDQHPNKEKENKNEKEIEKKTEMKGKKTEDNSEKETTNETLQQTQQQQEDNTNDQITTTTTEEEKHTTKNTYITLMEATKRLKTSMAKPTKTRVQSKRKANFKPYKNIKNNIRTIDTYFERGNAKKVIGPELKINTIRGLRCQQQTPETLTEPGPPDQDPPTYTDCNQESDG